MKRKLKSLRYKLAGALKQFTLLRRLYARLFDQERSQQFKLTQWMKQGGEITLEHKLQGVSFDAGEAWVTLPNGLQIRYLTEIPGAGVEPCIYHGEYEPEITQLLLEQLSGIGTFIDIGANIGWFSLHVAHNHPGMNIHAFEPGSFAHSNISKNISRNRFNQKIKLNQLVMSDRCGSEIFSTQQLGHPLNHIIRSNNGSSLKGEEIDATTLDRYITRNEIKSVEFIKCDVEGAEILVLKGAEKLLKRDQPKLLLEVNPLWTSRFDYQPEQLWVLLQSFGYHYHVIKNDGSKLCSNNFSNDVGEGANVYFTPHKNLS